MQALLDGGALPPAVWRPRRVDEILTRAADLGGGAIVFATDTVSYRDFHARVASAARELRRGAPVLIHPGPAETLLPALWAAFVAGAVPAIVPAGIDASALPPVGDETALLMATSGSTGAAKIVPLTHANIVASVAASAFVNGYRRDDVSLNWLPLWHVGGLMRSIREVYLNCTQVQLATSWIREDPLRWIDAIHTHRATLVWGSNAAFAAVVGQRPALTSRRAWSLECVRSIYSSGEAVAPPTMRAFAGMLAPYGLDAAAMRVAWGMTEACFATSSASLEDVGTPVPGVSLRIVDAAGRVCAERESGRLQIAGALVAAEGWLDTGDLASIANGRLRILGRASDAIRIGAITYANRDLETVVESIDGVAAAAACLVEDREGESLAIFVDADDRHVPDVRARVAERFGIVPRFVIPLAHDAFARTDVGKISRAALRRSFAAGAFPAARAWPCDLLAASAPPSLAPSPRAHARARELAAIFSDVLHVPIGVTDDVFACGGSSLRVAEAAVRIGCPLVDLFAAPTPLALAERLLRSASPVSAHRRTSAHDSGIAIVGAACRFPGAADLEAFWRLLSEGRDALTEFSAEELIAAGVAPRTIEDPAYVRAGMVLDDIAGFDAAFFGLSPRDAEVMDPQQRLLLECAWHALEDSGHAPGSERVGVWVGARQSDYMLFRMPPPDLFGHDGPPGEGLRRLVLNDKDYLATRIAHLLDCRGPAVSVQTACSSSLVAAHLAAQALRNGECDLALAGGVSLRVPQRAGYLYSEGMVYSPDGRTRPFDASAAGTVFGSGAGLVALRRLADAQRDGDRIYAVLRGSALNNDGAGPKAAFTAPSHAGQRRVIAEALSAAGVDASAISYVEAHGTATAVGDPIEIAALGEAYSGAPVGQCAIGSVKSNIGHLVQAAGVAGLIKAALMLHRRTLVPTVNFTAPNPLIAFDGSPFYVNTETRVWDGGALPRRAGVSAFGFGGTNAHIVLEEPPTAPIATECDLARPSLLPLSAKSPAALRALVDSFASCDAPLRDLCATAQQGRAHLPYRVATVASSIDELRERLRATAVPGAPAGSRPRIAFVFSGQGTQYAGMGRELFDTLPAFRRFINAHALTDVLFRDDLDRTDAAQPALVALEAGLAAVWRTWGIEPDVVVGHSVGEIAAACVAGVLRLEEAVRFAAARGRLMQQTADGAMAAVAAAEPAVAGWAGRVAVAAANAGNQTIVSGARGAVDAALATFRAQGIDARMLPIDRAFHSPLMDPILDALEAEAASLALAPPRCAIVSTLTAAAADADFARPTYWRRQAREPVRFAGALQTAAADVVIAIGPGHDGLRQMLTRLGELYVSGVDVNWPAVEEEPWRRVTLPQYPFQRTRYWIETRREPPPAAREVHPLLGCRVRSPLADAQFESEMTADVAPFARDHWIDGVRPLVMVAHLEMMRAAAGTSQVAIENVVVERPLLLADTPRHVHTVVGAGGDVSIYSSENGAEWTRHSTGAIRRGPVAPRSIDLAAVRARCPEDVAPEDIYAGLHARGAPIGPGMKLLQRVWRGNREVILQVALDAEAGESAAGYVAHPGLLDAVAQCADLTRDANERTAHDGLYLPTVVQRASFFGPLPNRVWATLRRRGDGGADVYGIDAEVVDDAGRVLVEVEGLHFKRAAPGALSRAEASAYEVAWQAVDGTGGPVEEGTVFHAAAGASAEDLCAAALDLAQTLLAADGTGPLWIVTRGAQATGRETAPLQPDQAALCGFGRALQREQPQLRVRLVDLDPSTDGDAGLAVAMAHAAGAGEVAVRNGVVYRRQLHRVTSSPELATPYVLRASANRTLEELTVAPVERRAPGPGEIEIEVRCTGVNFRDVLNATGRVDGPLGYECSGVVSRCGDGTTLLPATPVMALAMGSCASHVIVDARLAVRKPRHLTWAAAAACVVPYLTAFYGLLDRAGLRAGERVLIHTAAGGVGHAAVHVARAAGAIVVATASRGKQDLVRAMGVECVLDSRTPGFARAIEPVDVVLNTLGAEFLADNLAALRPGGRLVELGHPAISDLGAAAERASAAGVSFINFHVAQDADADLIQRRLSELSAALSSGALPALPYRSFAIGDAAAAFETMLRGAHVGKLVLAHPSAPAAEFGADPRATYVITGGNGAVGRHIARWLVERGARHLAVLSRGSVIADELLTSADVRTFRADVADATALEYALSQITQSMPPVRGIIHAAGVVDDALVSGQTRERLMRVLAPKVAGARNLHRLTERMPLECFVLVSSVAGLWGNAGQTPYAAGNAYLDQLAHFRRQRGLPATVVDFGLWRGAGMGATLTESARKRRAASGAAELAPDAALRGLESALAGDRVQTAVFAGTSPLTQGGHPALQPPAPSASESRPRDAQDALERVRAHVARMSGAAAIDVERPLAELGLDSLNVLLLRGRLIAEFGSVAALPVVSFLQAATVTSLASAICAGAGTAASTGASLTALTTTGSRVPVVLVPPVMRTAFRFAGLAHELAGRPVYGLTPAGLDGRSTPSDSIEQMAAQYVEELCTAVPRSSYVVAGACFGALVAWEMAQQLTARGAAVPLLVLLDADPLPKLAASRRERYTDAIGAPFEWLRVKGEGFARHRRQRTLRKWAAARLATPSNGVEVQLEDVVRAHWIAQQRYRARPFDGNVLLVSSAEKASASAHTTKRWRRIVSGRLDIVTMPGTTHIDILSDPYTPRVGGVIRERIDALSL